MSGRLVTPTLLRGVWQVAWWAFWIRVLGFRQRRLQMRWSVSVGPFREVYIYYYFPSPVSPTLCQWSGWGVISHLCPSLWHQRWCQFGATTDNESEDLLLGPPRVLEVIDVVQLSCLSLFFSCSVPNGRYDGLVTYRIWREGLGAHTG